MTDLIVEDGTGLPDAEAYVGVADFKAWADKRLVSLTDIGDDQIIAGLIKGTEWIDTSYRYKGSKLTSTQALEFPRQGCTDWSGYPVEGVPARVKNACCDLATKTFDGTQLYTDAARGGLIKSATVGPISTTFMDGAPAQTVYGAVNAYLEPYVIGGIDGSGTDGSTSLAAPPFFSGPTSENATFNIGMHDSGGGN